LSPTPFTYSVTGTPNPQSPSPSASLIQTEESPYNTDGGPGYTEPASEGDIQMEYSSGKLYSPSTEAITKNYL